MYSPVLFENKENIGIFKHIHMGRKEKKKEMGVGVK